MEYILHLSVLVAIYVVLALSLDLLVGQTGLLSVSHAAFYGVGAYTSALLTTYAGVPFLLGVVAAIAMAALLSLVVSLPSLRLRDDYFTIATFGVQMALYSIFNNWIELTRGPLGVSGIPQPHILGWEVQSRLSFAVIAGIFAALAFLVVQIVSRSAFGRTLRAIREDEVFASSLGKNTGRFKMVVFAVSAALAAASGSLYAHYVSFVDPTSFTLMESILILAMVIIGGAGSRWGPIVGATVLATMPEVLWFIGLPSLAAANIRQIIYGAALVGFMMWHPQGLAGTYRFNERSPDT